MILTFNKLWRMCVEKDIAPTVLFSSCGISTQTLYEMRHNNPVSLATIDRICTFLHCQPCDIMTLEEGADSTQSDPDFQN